MWIDGALKKSYVRTTIIFYASCRHVQTIKSWLAIYTFLLDSLRTIIIAVPTNKLWSISQKAPTNWHPKKRHKNKGTIQKGTNNKKAPKVRRHQKKDTVAKRHPYKKGTISKRHPYKKGTVAKRHQYIKGANAKVSIYYLFTWLVVKGVHQCSFLYNYIWDEIVSQSMKLFLFM